MSKNINLSYAKHLINLKNTDGNKEFVNEIKNRISSLKDKINEQKGKKIKVWMKHKRSLMKFLITIDKFKQHLKKQNQIQNLKKILQKA